MPDQASVAAKYDAFAAEVQGIGVAPPVGIGVGARVKVAAQPLLYTKVRTAPAGGTLIKSLPNGSLGNVTSGPTAVSGVNWWNVTFDEGTAGWTSGAQLAVA